jgi:hypothetical protein
MTRGPPEPFAFAALGASCVVWPAAAWLLWRPRKLPAIAARDVHLVLLVL